MTAHAVHARTRRGRRRAQVGAGHGRRVGVAEPRPRDQLAHRRRAGGDVATDVVGVVRREAGRVGDVGGRRSARARRGRTARAAPGRPRSRRRCSRAARARRPTPGARRRRTGSGRRGTAARPARTAAPASGPGHVGLGARDLLEGAAEVDGACRAGRLGGPRDAALDGEVELVRRTVAVAPRAAASVAGDLGEGGRAWCRTSGCAPVGARPAR